MPKYKFDVLSAYKNESGAIVIILSLILVALVGFVSISSLMSTSSVIQNQLQAAVDAAALSGSAELCGTMNCYNNARTVALNVLKEAFVDQGVSSSFLKVDDSQSDDLGYWTLPAENLTLSIERGRVTYVEDCSQVAMDSVCPEIKKFTSVEGATWETDYPGLSKQAVSNAVRVTAKRNAISSVYNLYSAKPAIDTEAVAIYGSIEPVPILAPFALPLCAVLEDNGDIDLQVEEFADRYFLPWMDRFRGGGNQLEPQSFFGNPCNASNGDSLFNECGITHELNAVGTSSGLDQYGINTLATGPADPSHLAFEKVGAFNRTVLRSFLSPKYHNGYLGTICNPNDSSDPEFCDLLNQNPQSLIDILKVIIDTGITSDAFYSIGKDFAVLSSDPNPGLSSTYENLLEEKIWPIISNQDRNYASNIDQIKYGTYLDPTQSILGDINASANLTKFTFYTNLGFGEARNIKNCDGADNVCHTEDTTKAPVENFRKTGFCPGSKRYELKCNGSNNFQACVETKSDFPSADLDWWQTAGQAVGFKSNLQVHFSSDSRNATPYTLKVLIPIVADVSPGAYQCGYMFAHEHNPDAILQVVGTALIELYDVDKGGIETETVSNDSSPFAMDFYGASIPSQTMLGPNSTTSNYNLTGPNPWYNYNEIHTMSVGQNTYRYHTPKACNLTRGRVVKGSVNIGVTAKAPRPILVDAKL